MVGNDRKDRLIHRAVTLVSSALAIFCAVGAVTLVARVKSDSDLISAIKSNDTASALALLNRGADPDACDYSRHSGGFVRWIADEAGRVFRLRTHNREYRESAILILCNPNYPGKSGYGVQTENVVVLRALLAKGANVRATDSDGYSSLAYAVAFGNWQTATQLVESGADVNARGYDYQPILTSCVRRPGLVLLLLHNGAAVDARTERGETALMAAAEYNEINSVKLLLAYGARADAVDRDGKTALDYAIADYAGTCQSYLSHLKHS